MSALSLRERREEANRSDTEASYWSRKHDEQLAGEAFVFAKALALLVKDHCPRHRSEIMEGAREAWVSDFADMDLCYAAFAEAEVAA